MLKVHVGPGYREVLPSEPLREGDEYWSPLSDCWRFSYVAKRGGCPGSEIFYRRKLEITTTHKPGIPAGDGYRELPKGSCCSYATIQAGTPIKAGQIVGVTLGSGDAITAGQPVYLKAGKNWRLQTEDGQWYTIRETEHNSGKFVVTSSSVHGLEIGTRVYPHNGKWYRAFRNPEEYKTYRNMWVIDTRPPNPRYPALKSFLQRRVRRITQYNDHGVEGRTWDKMMQDCMMEDGSPFGVAIQ